ncbi:MAG: hypothetical protein D6782_12105 [Alphaproteobacteria bacterium]|nr:MAG: hypothetical protein D6782_12105 [Alphaproteobacteria bacterium]
MSTTDPRLHGVDWLRAIVCALAVFLFDARAAVGKDDKPAFEIDVSAGSEYDSNITVNEIDQATGADDFAAVFDADINVDAPLGADTDASLGYSFSQSLHADFTNFDLQTHFASAELSHDFGGFDVGGAYRFVYSRLGGSGFLTLQQLSPSVSFFLGKTFFIRAEYSYTDKGFKNRTDRDAKVHAGGADIYFFLDGVRTYIVAGYKFERENTTAPQFDFDGHNFKLRFSKRIAMGKRDAKLKLGWRYEARDYDNITPSIGVRRDDDRHRLEAELEIPLSDRFYVLADYTYADFSSNLPSADYSQNLVSARIGYRF